MEEKTTNGLGVASLVLGIMALLFSCCYGGAIGIIGLVLGLIALSKKNLSKGCAIGGVVTSTISIVITLIVVVLGVSFVNELDKYSNNNSTPKVITSKNPNSTSDADNKSDNTEISDGKTDDTENTIISFGTEGISDNLSLKVNKVASKKEISESEFYSYKPDSGKYAVVNVTIKNNGKESESLSIGYFKLVSSDGAEYQPTMLFGLNDNYINFETINPNLDITGNLVFEVPSDLKVSSATLQFSGTGLFSENTVFSLAK